MTDVVGWADLHCHPMAHLGYGGMRNGHALFWGTPTGPVDQALPCCTDSHSFWHGPKQGLIAHFIEHESSFDGYPTFKSWPRSTTLIHQQMYLTGIRRAFEGGLRVMVASAVSNELLGDLFHGSRPETSDEVSMPAQLAGMRAFAAQQSSWMEIAESPADARRIIASNKLAVVLGVEADSIAGGAMRRDGQLDPMLVDALVQRWFALGVRLINPLHLADNALGGCAVFDDRFNLSSHYLVRKYASQLPEPWFFEIDRQKNLLEGVEFLLGGNPDSGLMVQIYHHGYPNYRQMRPDGHINAKGLTFAGQTFMHSMMRRGMLVDVEHMSWHTLDGAIHVASGFAYPLFSTHTGLRALAVPRGAQPWVRGVGHEGQKTDGQVAQLKALGSVIGLAGHLGPLHDVSYDSSAAWARSYRYARDHLGLDAIAVGTDMHGFGGQASARFTKDAQGRYHPVDPQNAVRALDYGIDTVPHVGTVLRKSVLGSRDYDFNVDGLAQYGMLPDFVTDVALEVGGAGALDAFFRSAEAFLRAWETCLARAPSVPSVP